MEYACCLQPHARSFPEGVKGQDHKEKKEGYVHEHKGPLTVGFFFSFDLLRDLVSLAMSTDDEATVCQYVPLMSVYKEAMC